MLPAHTLPPAAAFVSSAFAVALYVLAIARRPLWSPLTVAWQLRAPLALSGVALAAVWFAAGHAPLAGALSVGAAGVMTRVALERARGRSRRAPEGPHASLHVLTHNCGLHRSDPRRVAEFIADCGADIVGLQEIEATHARALDELVAETHPHRALFATGVDGIGLVSRHPILDAELVQLEGKHAYLVAHVDAPGGPLRVVVFHPSAWIAVRGARHEAVRDLARLALEAARDAPAILMGDLNSTDATGAWDAFAAAGLVDAYRAVGAGSGVTFPVPFKYLWLPVPPLVRIDYVFATQDLVPTRAEVGPPTTSDHLPLFATLVRRRAADLGQGAARAS